MKDTVDVLIGLYFVTSEYDVAIFPVLKNSETNASEGEGVVDARRGDLVLVLGFRSKYVADSGVVYTTCLFDGRQGEISTNNITNRMQKVEMSIDLRKDRYR